MKTMEERLTALDAAIARGDVIRGWWRVDYGGIERVCLLVAMFPEVHNKANECPAGYMPPWFLECVPAIDDLGTEERWKDMLPRFARAMRMAAQFTEKQWDQLQEAWTASSVKSCGIMDLNAIERSQFGHDREYLQRKSVPLAERLRKTADYAYTHAEHAEQWDAITENLFRHIEDIDDIDDANDSG